MDWGLAFARLGLWYGIGFAEASRMPQAAIGAYLGRTPAVAAEVKLVIYEAVTAALAGRAGRRAVRRWQREVTGQAAVRRPRLSDLAGMGIAVVSRDA